MPGRTDNSFTRPLPYCPTSTCGLTAVCPKSFVLRIYIGQSTPFSRHHVHRVSYYSPALAGRTALYRVFPYRTGYSRFLRAAVAALHALPGPVRRPIRLLGVISRLPVPNRLQPVFSGRSTRHCAPRQRTYAPPHPDCRYRPRSKSRRNAKCEFVCSSHGQQPCLRLIPAS